MITINKDEEHKILELGFDGKMTHKDFEDCIKPIEEMIAKYGKIKVLEKFVSFSGMEPSVFWDGLKFDINHRKHYSHCAVVTDKKWMQNFTHLVGAMVGVEVKVFELEQLDEARRWLQEAK